LYSKLHGIVLIIRSEKFSLAVSEEKSSLQKFIDRNTHFAEEKLDITQVTAKFGGSTDEEDVDGNTPVHWASVKGHNRVLEFLIESNFRVYKPHPKHLHTCAVHDVHAWPRWNARDTSQIHERRHSQFASWQKKTRRMVLFMVPHTVFERS
jgi:ankyrin repeat protein